MKVLFITANRLGDAILSTGILAALIERYPLASFTIACGPLPAPLFRAFAHVETIIPLIKGRFAKHWRALLWQAIGTRWDLIVDLRGSPVPFLVSAKRRLVWRKTNTHQHKVEELARIVHASPPPSPRLWLEADAIFKAQALLPKEQSILVIAPGANSVGKRWPAERYAALAEALTAPTGIMPDAAIVLLGDNNDQPTAQIVASRLPVVDLTGKLDLPTTAACLARADFYVGNDSGLTHMAAALKLPTLALFGPGVAWKYSPWGDHAAYVSAADDPTRTHDLCRDGDAGAIALMQRLSVEEVVAAANDLWHKVRHD